MINSHKSATETQTWAQAHTHTNILSPRRTHNWAIFSLRERKERPGSSQWNRPQDPELQSLGASSPPEHTTLLKLTEPHQKASTIYISSTTNRRSATCYSHTQCQPKHSRMQSRTYACKLCGADIWKWEPPHMSSIWAHQMEIRHTHDAVSWRSAASPSSNFLAYTAHS